MASSWIPINKLTAVSTHIYVIFYDVMVVMMVTGEIFIWISGRSYKIKIILRSEKQLQFSPPFSLGLFIYKFNIYVFVIIISYHLDGLCV